MPSTLQYIFYLVTVNSSNICHGMWVANECSADLWLGCANVVHHFGPNFLINKILMRITLAWLDLPLISQPNAPALLTDPFMNSARIA